MYYATALYLLAALALVLGGVAVFASFRLERNETIAVRTPWLHYVVGFFGYLLLLVGASCIVMRFVIGMQVGA